VFSRADPETTWANADRVIMPTVPIVAVIVTVGAIPPDLNVDALGLYRSSDRGSRQHCYGCRHDENDLHHCGILLRFDTEKPTRTSARSSISGFCGIGDTSDSCGISLLVLPSRENGVVAVNEN
jgi:hypothetical protein